MTPNEVADYLVEKLKDNFSILRYDAKKTASIYLKLDYGVVGSIRISDHKGYKGLSYTFNVECGREEDDISIADGHIRYYYCAEGSSLDRLVAEADKKKLQIKKKYGKKMYKRLMQRNFDRGLNEERKNRACYKFWHQARLIQ